MGVGDLERDNLVSDFYPAFKNDAPAKRRITMTPKARNLCSIYSNIKNPFIQAIITHLQSSKQYAY